MDVRHASFLAAIAIPQFCIGKRLKPYSIGHQIALKATDNAFVQDLHLPQELRPVPAFPDLIEAAFICSRSFEEGQRQLYSGWLPFQMKFWATMAGRFDIFYEIQNFQRVVADANEIVDANKIHDGSTFTPVSPWENRLRIWLLRQGLAKSQSEAWNYPLKLALIDEATTGEAEGKVSLFSDVDAELMRVAKSMDEKEVTK